MIPEKETITVEFKSDRGKLNDSILVDAVVAFANTEGGRIFLGVEDDGTVTGLHREHMDPYGQEAMIINKTVPGVAVHSEMTEEQGKKIMIITVPKKNAIIASSDGKVLKRRLKQDGTPENVPMYPFEMQTRLSDLNMLDFSSQILPDTTIEDLDPLERQRLRNIIRLRKGEGILLELSDEEQTELKENGVGIEYPFSKEKLSPVLAYYVVKDSKEGIDLAEKLIEFGGMGHSAVIHSEDENVIQEFSKRVKVGRIIVNSPSTHGAIGDIYNTNMPSLTLGCGTFGGNSTTSNVSSVNLINIKRVAKRRVNMQWFKIPNKIYFEAGSLGYLEKMPDITKAFIVTDEGMVKLGYVDKVLYYLRKRE